MLLYYLSFDRPHFHILNNELYGEGVEWDLQAKCKVHSDVLPPIFSFISETDAIMLGILHPRPASSHVVELE